MPTQPPDQHLSAAGSAPLNHFIITCHPLDQRLLAAISLPNQLRDQRLLNRLISTCQPLYQHQSATITAPVNCLISDPMLRDQILLSHVISDAQPVDQLLSAP